MSVNSNSANLFTRAARVLRENGPRVLIAEVATYLRGVAYSLYWQFRYGVDYRHTRVASTSTELPVLTDLFANLRADDVFYDVGAYKGLFTLPVASVLPPGHVVAFEPGDGATALEASLAEAGLTATVVRKAVSASGGQGYHEHEGRLGLLGDSEGSDGFATIDAHEIVDADELPLPTVVKIDVFGAETDVIAALEPILARPDCRLVYCELHLPTSFQRSRPEPIFEQFLDEWSFTDIVRTLYRCGFEVDPIYLRADTHDLFLKAYRPDAPPSH